MGGSTLIHFLEECGNTRLVFLTSLETYWNDGISKQLKDSSKKIKSLGLSHLGLFSTEIPGLLYHQIR